MILVIILFVFILYKYICISGMYSIENLTKAIANNPAGFLTALIALFSAIVAFITYNHNKRQSKINISIKIAEEFCNKISHLSGNITREFEKHNLYEKIETKIDLNNIKYFNSKELVKIIPKDFATEYLTSTSEENFRNQIAILLNNLEYISMYIRNNLTNDKVIYQSLHQIFLKSVKMCYIYIAYKNQSKPDKFFTNIIYVYRKWYKKFKRHTEYLQLKKKLMDIIFRDA